MSCLYVALLRGSFLIDTFIDDGSMRKDAREAALNKIKSSSATRVILISFKAGSTGTFVTTFVILIRRLMNCAIGLNLTACNNVILVDLW